MNFNQQFLAWIAPLAILLASWSLFWKGMALWKAAGKKHLVWFIILLAVNTVGILEILYLFWLNRWGLGSERLLTSLRRKADNK